MSNSPAQTARAIGAYQAGIMVGTKIENARTAYLKRCLVTGTPVGSAVKSLDVKA
jgi:hypothetical protein